MPLLLVLQGNKVTMTDDAQQSRFKLTSTVPKTRLGLSLAERIKVIEARQMGKSMRQLATQFGCGKTQILNTLTQKERYIHEWEVMGRNNPSIGARKRFRHSRNEKINRSVHDWYQQQTASGIRVTGPMLQNQARHYATQLEISNFGASNGWLANFRRFYNIVSSYTHLKKQNPNITFHQYHPTAKNKNVADHQSTSSKFHESSEFVPVIPVCDTYDRQSSTFVSSAEQDPLPGENQQPLELTGKQANLSSSQIENCVTTYHTTKPHLFKLPENYSTGKKGKRNRNEKFISSSSVTSHRKRQLLQIQNAEQPSSCHDVRFENENIGNVSKERRIPRLVPITPVLDCLSEFANLACANGLLTLTMKDDCGHRWVEVRQSATSFRVPKHGYPAHLTRLVVDYSLQYFVEVLGHCVQHGSLHCNSNNRSLNYLEATSVLSAVNGKYVVCAGVEAIPDRMADEFRPKAVQEFQTAKNMCLTLPDHRYRSNQCAKWIDNQLGPNCGACKEATIEFSTAPMDLRCTPSNHK
ncbi:uncharacterized protein LOC130688195 isoform X2 [Daphnia carinata]|uniref:uncharacterized protein LOC130688195 isoform X2 n=1 Tax=Daphnia carinata TaxID=120202 RepID=UPI0028684AD7|nr:uncharacterized protein LOC130688195 isoform X2 [Daphnia carinata]